MNRSLPCLERLREWLIKSPFINTSLKHRFIKDYYHSSLSDIDLFDQYHKIIVNTLS